MKFLLDTHVILWWLADDPALKPNARSAISDTTNLVYISAVSLWEIVIKQGLGKLQLPEDWAGALMREPFGQLSINFQHALTVGKLPAIHKDPFDRLLIAQCLDEDLTLVTHDATLQHYDLPILLT
ncbi:MAG: type II toxin-antitoxin system VapC family toxin [Phycisphaerales bacterium]|jgi:PIN domain nuclease of toxin-antitoxin system|nr:type II toxin-antitoxin system VapC family toxin [Phycisphaerales bacterium]